MTNEDYVQRLQNLSNLPIEEQLREAIVLIGERATSQAAQSAIGLHDVVRREIADLKREFDRVLLVAHEIANSAARMHGEIELMQAEGTRRSQQELAAIQAEVAQMRVRSHELTVGGFARMEIVEQAIAELRSDSREACRQRILLSRWMMVMVLLSLMTLLMMAVHIAAITRMAG